ncbi:MAG: tetratricopeptide repeat protein, partial [Rhodoplanes sp.]
MSDIFREVDEEVRREQLKRLWDRYGLLFIATAVLLVAAVGAWRGY